MSDRLDIGAVKSVKIDVLTETGWFDDARFKQDMADYGGSEQTQYRIAWDRENAGGYSALLTITTLDGDRREDPARHRLEHRLDGLRVRPPGRRPDARERRDRLHGAVALAPRSLLGDRVDAEA